MIKAYLSELSGTIDDVMERGFLPALAPDLLTLLTLKKELADLEASMPAAEAEKFGSEEIKTWVAEMKNTDGTTGEHWSLAQTTAVGREMGLNFQDFAKECWWAAMNMVYSDYYPAAQKFGVDRTDFYAALALDFLRDPDGKSPKNKLKNYYFHVVA